MQETYVTFGNSNINRNDREIINYLEKILNNIGIRIYSLHMQVITAPTQLETTNTQHPCPCKTNPNTMIIG
jgi:hypothetical protein